MLRHKTMAPYISTGRFTEKNNNIKNRQTRLKNTVEIMKKIFIFFELTEMICRGSEKFFSSVYLECHSN